MMSMPSMFYANDLMRDMREVAKGLDVPAVYRMRGDGTRGAHPLFAMRLSRMKEADLATQRLGSSLLLQPDDSVVQADLVKAAGEVHRQGMRVLELSDSEYALSEVSQAAQRAELSFAAVAQRLVGDPEVDGVRQGLRSLVADNRAIAMQYRVVYDDLKTGRAVGDAMVFEDQSEAEATVPATG